MDPKILFVLICIPFTVYGLGQGSQCSVELFLGFLFGKGFEGDSIFDTNTNAKCPDNFSKLKNGQCYMFVKSPQLSWEQARIDCQTRGSHLVIINDAKENTEIRKYLLLHDGEDDYWTGLNDRWEDGVFMWDTKPHKFLTSKSFTDWQDGEPNNMPERQACVRLNPDAQYQWADFDCDQPFSYVCERSPKRKFKCNSW